MWLSNVVFAKIILLVLYFGTFVGFSYQEGFFTVGPKLIRPSTPYKFVLVNFLSNLVRINVTLEGSNSNGNVVLCSHKTIAIKRGRVQSAFFEVGNIAEGIYTLTMESLESNFNFAEVVDLEYHSKTESVFVQLDKPLYKPGDVIKFRIIVVNIDLKPVSDSQTVDVNLLDAAGSTIMKWSNIKLNNGIFESNFRIASSPILGTWNLITKTGNSELSTKFDLREYVPPKFYIQVIPAKVHVASYKEFKLTIMAAYTFGKPVNGTVTVDITYDSVDGKKLKLSKTLPIVNSVTVEFNYDKELEIFNGEDSRDILVQATVKELFSNRVESVDVSVPVYRNRYEITTSSFGSNFIPGRKLDIYIRIKDRYDSCPMGGKFATIEILECSPVCRTLNHKKMPNRQGEIILEIFTVSNAVFYQIKKITYDSDEYDEFPAISASQLKSNPRLNITYNKKNYKIIPGQDVKFEITTTDVISDIVYVVISRGRIIDCGTKKYSPYFKYRLTRNLAPKLTLIIMYLKDYLVYDSLELEFDRLDNNFDFSLDPSPSHDYKPGQEIHLQFNAANDSYVAFHGIDQSILYLGQKNNLLSRTDLIDALSQFEQTDLTGTDNFHSMGLFLRTTVELDSHHKASKLTRSAFISNQVFEKPTNIRTQLTESWLWENYMMLGNESREIRHYVPDTITSWTITGFALSRSAGLSIIKEPVVAKVNDVFFIDANLPYSIKRGEVAVVQASVFHKIGADLSVDVKLYRKHDEFEFYNYTSPDNFQKKTILVEHENGKSAIFFIKAKKLGEIAIKIEAFTMGHKDSVEHILRVIPESVFRDKNEVQFININQSMRNTNFSLDIPRDIDSGSAKIVFEFSPDLLSITRENLDSLIQMPTGCCEQSMAKFVPDIVVLDYLEATHKIEDDTKNKAINFLKEGYQNQLKCKLNDNSFSIFRNEDNGNFKKGSVFLTAFIAKSLKIADKHISVDKQVVVNALNWLAQQQQSDGRFKETSEIYMSGMQNSNFALTAYVLVAFLETEDIGRQFQHVVNKSIEYLSSNFYRMEDPYDLAVTSYAMSMAKVKEPAFLEKLMHQSITCSKNNFRFWNHTTLDIQIASYALLAKLANRNETIDSIPIVTWLQSQRASQGGFYGTQETFVGLKALAKFAELADPTKNEYNVRVGAPGLTTFSVHQSDMKPKKIEIDSAVRFVQVEVSGFGLGYYQIRYQYHRNIFNEKSSFNLTVNVLNDSTYKKLHLKVCVAFKPKEDQQTSNMALVEVAFPSGIVGDKDAVEDLSPKKEIQKIELLHGRTSLVVYYMNLDAMEKCFKVTAERRFPVAMHRSAYVVVYDYYDNQKTDRFAIKQYEGKVLQPCELCEGEDCVNFGCH